MFCVRLRAAVLRYADPRLNEKPYNQPTFRQFCKQLCRREELEYDMYENENYQAELYGENHWDHQPDIDSLARKPIAKSLET